MIFFLHGFTGTPSTGDLLRERLPLRATSEWNAPPILGHQGAPAECDAFTLFAQEVDRLVSLVEAVEAQEAQEAAKAAEATTTRGAVLIGYSQGGRLALSMAHQLSKKGTPPAALILLGANPGLDDTTERAQRRDIDEQRAHQLCPRVHGDLEARAAEGNAQRLASFLQAWEALPLFDEDALPAHRRETRQRARRQHTPEGLAHALRVLGLGAMPPIWDSLSTLNCPTLFLAGARDEKFCSIGRRVVTALPHGRLVVIPDAAHDVLLHAPDQVARHVTSFLGEIGEIGEFGAVGTAELAPTGAHSDNVADAHAGLSSVTAPPPQSPSGATK